MSLFFAVQFECVCIPISTITHLGIAKIFRARKSESARTPMIGAKGSDDDEEFGIYLKEVFTLLMTMHQKPSCLEVKNHPVGNFKHKH